MKAEIIKEFSFEAAHRLPEVGTSHKCSRLHGHLFRVEVAITGEVDPELGWVLDFGDLAREAGQIISTLDHTVLNDIEGLANPTSENLAKYLFDRISPVLPGVTAIIVHESPFSRCIYRPVRPEADTSSGDFRITATQIVFSAAHYLVFSHEGREPIHGHDYAVVVTGTTDSPAPGARETLHEIAQSVIAPMDHRVLLAATPASGKMSIDEKSIRIETDNTVTVLPAGDCYLMGQTANTTTELIAAHIADPIAEDPRTGEAGFNEIEVEVMEGGNCRAKVVSRVKRDIVP